MSKDEQVEVNSSLFKQITSLPIEAINLCEIASGELPVINVVNKEVRNLSVDNMKRVEKIQLNCQRLEELSFRSIQFSEDLEKEDLMERFLCDLIEGKSNCPSLHRISLGCDFFSEEVLGESKNPFKILIPKFALQNMHYLRMDDFYNLVELEIQSSSLKCLEIHWNRRLRVLKIESPSLNSLLIEGTDLKKLEVKKADCFKELNLSNANTIEELLLESERLETFRLDIPVPQHCIIESLRKCPNVRILEIRFNYISFGLPTPTDKLMKMVPEVCGNLKKLNLSSKAFRISEKTLKLVQRRFSERGTQLEIDCKYLLETGESSEEENEGAAKRSVISKWKQNSLFKFFNSWRNYRDKCALKAYKTWTMAVWERLEWTDINSPDPYKVKDANGRFIPLR